MTFQIPDDQEAALRIEAQALGVSAEQYAQELINRDLEQEVRRPVSAVIRELWSDMPDDVCKAAD